MDKKMTAGKADSSGTQLPQEELSKLDSVADRVRLAQYGLARPLLAMRHGQLQREAERVAAHLGADHPQSLARAAQAKRMQERVWALERDLERLRIDPPRLESDNGAGIYGRVVAGRTPTVGASVIVLREGERLGSACTDARGAYCIEVPAGGELIVSVRTKDGGEPYRDAQPFTLMAGQKLFRELDLEEPGVKPCPAPPGDAPLPPTVVKVPDLLRLTVTEAGSRLVQERLTLGQQFIQEVTDPGEVERVVGQSPEAGASVAPGTVVHVTVGVKAVVKIEVPQLAKRSLKQDEAVSILVELGLQPGKITHVPTERPGWGVVVDQSPGAGEVVPEKTQVALSIGVETLQGDGASVKDVASRAEKSLRAAAPLLARPPGFLAEKLNAAGVNDLADLQKFLELKHEVVLERLGLDTRWDADLAISALRLARGELSQ